jgi:hypothetical protein
VSRASLSARSPTKGSVPAVGTSRVIILVQSFTSRSPVASLP